MSRTKRTERVWLEPCKRCGKKHKWILAACGSCGVYTVPRTVSEKACYSDESCDGCQAYREHQA